MLVLFDIDNTLFDHHVSERAAAISLHRVAGGGRSADEFAEAWSAALEHNFERYLAGELSYDEQRRARVREAVDPGLTDQAADDLLEHYLEAYLAASALFLDALPCLDRLSSHRLGIVSNGLTSHQLAKLARTGIADRFECILISEECGHAKPAPEIFLAACARLGESPAGAVHVGDRYDLDAEGARRAGLRGIWLDRARQAGPAHLPPIISGLDELDRLL